MSGKRFHEDEMIRLYDKSNQVFRNPDTSLVRLWIWGLRHTYIHSPAKLPHSKCSDGLRRYHLFTSNLPAPASAEPRPEQTSRLPLHAQTDSALTGPVADCTSCAECVLCMEINPSNVIQTSPSPVNHRPHQHCWQPGWAQTGQHGQEMAVPSLHGDGKITLRVAGSSCIANFPLPSGLRKISFRMARLETSALWGQCGVRERTHWITPQFFSLPLPTFCAARLPHLLFVLLPSISLPPSYPPPSPLSFQPWSLQELNSFF